MLHLLFSIAAAPPVAVDVSGMEPQLAIVRREAAAQGWRIVCEGRAGEEGVLRVQFPADTSEEAIRSFSDADRHLGSSHYFYYSPGDVPAGCDHVPVTGSADGPVRVLDFGPPEEVRALAAIARDCGLARAFARPASDDDLPAGAGAVDPGWFALDAGEDAGPRYGPVICFVQMRTRASSSGATGPE